jgi:hypothetical protein
VALVGRLSVWSGLVVHLVILSGPLENLRHPVYETGRNDEVEDDVGVFEADVEMDRLVVHFVIEMEKRPVLHHMGERAPRAHLATSEIFVGDRLDNRALDP